MKYTTSSLLSAILVTSFAGHKEVDARVVGALITDTNPTSASVNGQSIISKEWKSMFSPVYQSILDSLSANDKSDYSRLGATHVPATYDYQWAKNLFDNGFNSFLFSNPGSNEGLSLVDSNGQLHTLRTQDLSLYMSPTSGPESQDHSSAHKSGAHSDSDSGSDHGSRHHSNGDDDSSSSSKHRSRHSSSESEDSESTGDAASKAISIPHIAGLMAAVMVGTSALI
ncbi:hypothetical protein H4219_003009 [Mycoemilia scoparia]|uniref:Uncharacterized protein n=1 Tax=Mycoemilia scoparia TaxID=417184 RepID=A0A9W7ZWR9_9FUNG|nr:hypothetical protein H4219_003009 [Mycoemilia scoparia]